MPEGTPTPSSVLSALSKARLVDLARELGVGASPSATKEQQLERLVKTSGIDLPLLARLLTRDELKQACKRHGLDDAGRSRIEPPT